jgi:hypothetical protein
MHSKILPDLVSSPGLDLWLDKQMPKNINFGLWKKLVL